MLSRIIKSVIIIISAYILLKLIQYILNKIFKITKFDVRYENTLCSVLLSISYYIIFAATLILILKEFQIMDITKFGSIVTGASIIGLLAGIAAQSILKDIFNGFFILFEKQIQVGDFVTINDDFRGRVEEIGLRSVSLRDWDLKRITIANGNILTIKNYSKKKMRVVAHVRVSYREDPMNVMSSLEEVCNIMNENYKEYLYKNKQGQEVNEFSVYGVTDIESNPVGAQYTITGVVQSHKYFSALKDTRLQILIVFNKNNINIAYPTHINIINTNNDNDEI